MQQFFFGCSYCGLGVLYQLKITNYPLSLQPKNGKKKNLLCKRGFQHKECFKADEIIFLKIISVEKLK